MSVEPGLLLIGIPLLLLAAGLLLNAYLLVRRPQIDPTDLALEAMATESMDGLLLELQRSVEELKGQLAGQRATLAGLLSDASTYAPPVAAFESRSPPGGDLAAAAPDVPEVVARAVEPSTGDPRSAVQRLVAEGLSDRAIARRLRIGLEEVRLSRLPHGRAS